MINSTSKMFVENQRSSCHANVTSLFRALNQYQNSFRPQCVRLSLTIVMIPLSDSAQPSCAGKTLFKIQASRIPTWKNVIENSCAYMDDVELEWLGGEDVDIRRRQQFPWTALLKLGSMSSLWVSI